MSENSTEKGFSILLKEIDKALKVVDVEKLTENIKTFRLSSKKGNEEKIQASNEIIDIVFETFGLTRDDLMARRRSLEKQYAICFSCFFLSKKLNLKNIEISLLLNRYPTTVSQCISDVNKLSEKYDFQKNAFEKKKIIEEKLKHYGPRH